MKYRFLCGSLAFLLSGLGVAQAQILNEIVVNPPSTDNPYEYIELKAPKNQVLNRIQLVVFEGDNSITNPTQGGIADFVVNLNGVSVGSNGIVVVKSPTGGHASHPQTISLFDARFDNAGGFLEGGTISFALVSGAVPLIETSDYDTNDDGILDLPAGSVLVDAVGWTDGGAADVVYGSVSLNQSAGNPDAATRFPTNTSPFDVGAWYNGDLDGIANGLGNVSTVYDLLRTSANFPTGGVLSPGAGNMPSSGLPLDWISVEASHQNQTTSLKWTTANETNCMGFEVEQSTFDEQTNRQTAWQTMGFVVAQNGLKNSYQFVDDSKNEDNRLFYRLKQIDADGRYQYSKTVACVLPVAQKVQVNGSLSNGYLGVEISQSEQNIALWVVDALGNLVLIQQLGNGTHQLDLSHLARGIYFVRIADQTHKIFIY